MTGSDERPNKKGASQATEAIRVGRLLLDGAAILRHLGSALDVAFPLGGLLVRVGHGANLADGSVGAFAALGEVGLVGVRKLFGALWVEDVLEVNEGERNGQDGCTDDVAEKRSDKALPDVETDAEVGLVAHQTDGDEEHVCDNVIETGSDKDKDGEPSGEDLGVDFGSHGRLEDGDADEDVAADTAEEDVAEVGGNDLHARKGGRVGRDRAGVDVGKVDEETGDEERTSEVTDEDDGPVEQEPPDRGLLLNRGHHEGLLGRREGTKSAASRQEAGQEERAATYHHVASQELLLEEHNHDETDWEDGGRGDLYKTGVLHGQGRGATADDEGEHATEGEEHACEKGLDEPGGDGGIVLLDGTVAEGPGALFDCESHDGSGRWVGGGVRKRNGMEGNSQLSGRW